MEELVRGVKIGVECVISNGEETTKYFGFNFIVKEADKNEMKNFVAYALACFEIPYEEIYLYKEDNYPISKIWTKEMIVCEMRRNQEELKWERKHGRRY